MEKDFYTHRSREMFKILELSLIKIKREKEIVLVYYTRVTYYP